MLTFDQKLEIFSSFPQLQRKNVSLGRINFHYEKSISEKKTVGYHLHPNGNGFVYAGQLLGSNDLDKGMVNIRNYSAEQLTSLIRDSIVFLSKSHTPSASHSSSRKQNPLTDQTPLIKEQWIDSYDQILILMSEEDLWNIYSGICLEMAFETYKEAVSYLREEGFSRL